MKLYEKKCPNCGAKLEFGDSDTSCTCSYCGRNFEIERENDKYKLINTPIENINDLMNNKFLFSKVSIVFTSIIICVVAVFVFTNILNIGKNRNINATSSNGDEFTEETADIKDKTTKYLKDVSEISNRDFDYIDSHSKSAINTRAEGQKESKKGYRSFSIDGKIKRVKIYVAYKEDGNYLISIYKATYEDFFNTKDRSTVYIPIVYENIEKNIMSTLGNAKLKAPKFYLTKDKKVYTYGYKTKELAYSKVVEPLESEYLITSK